MKVLCKLIENSEEWLISWVLDYAIEHDYAKYTSTLREAWRKSINDLSERLLSVLQDAEPKLELHPDIDYTQDPIASYGVLQSQRHRERGVDVAMFMGLLKYYRQSYIDLVIAAGFERESENQYRLIIDKFFNRIEVGLCAERVEVNKSKVLRDLQASNRSMTNEKNKYLTIYESLPIPVIILDENKHIDTMNHAAATIFGDDSTPGESYYSEEPSIKTLSWLTDELTVFTKNNLRQLNFVKRFDTKRGTLYFSIKFKKMLDLSGKFVGTVVMLNNITSRKQAGDDIKRVNAELKQILNTAAGGMRIIDKDYKVLLVNDTFANLAGLNPEEAVGKKCYETLKGIFCHTDNCPLTRIISGDERVEYDVEKERCDGIKMPCFVTAAPFLAPDGELVGIVQDIRDITERKKMEEQLKYISLRDALTGLYNRTYFEQEMRRMDEGHCDPVGVIVCDVDGLKPVNDTLGHNAGDDLLKTVATIIKMTFRQDDMVARIGGDEFVVLLPNTDYDAVQNSYERIKNAIAIYNATNPKLPLSISVGFAIKKDANTSINDTFKKADNNMYREKRGNYGRN